MTSNNVSYFKLLKRFVVCFRMCFLSNIVETKGKFCFSLCHLKTKKVMFNLIYATQVKNESKKILGIVNFCNVSFQTDTLHTNHNTLYMRSFFLYTTRHSTHTDRTHKIRTFSEHTHPLYSFLR